MPKTNGGIVIPFGLRQNVKIQVEHNGVTQDVVIPWFVISPEQEEAKKKLLKNQFFLLRQGELGEISKCRRCGKKERYFTLMCVERPFDGLRQGLLAYYHHVGKNGGQRYLSSVELQRFEEIQKIVVQGRADIGTSHPQFARTLGTGDDDFDIGAVSLGLLEPITRQKAESLAWNINLRGIKPPFKLEGLESKNATISL